MFSEARPNALSASLDDEQTKANIPEFVKKYKMDFPVLVGATVDHMAQFGAGQVLPATVILDQNGMIVARILGEAKKGDVFNRVEWMLGIKKSKEPTALIGRVPKR